MTDTVAAGICEGSVRNLKIKSIAERIVVKSMSAPSNSPLKHASFETDSTCGGMARYEDIRDPMNDTFIASFVVLSQ